MRAEIVSVGSELLLGQIVDTNAALIARQLAALGMDLFQKTTVGDNLGRVAAALETALGRADVVITTGGLGPTEDDITREAVARASGTRPGVSPRAPGPRSRRSSEARGCHCRPRTGSRRTSRGAPFHCRIRSAPPPVSFSRRASGRSSCSPGFRGRWSTCCARRPAAPPRRYGLQAAIVSRLVRVAGLGESRVGELLADLMAKGANPTVGTMAHPGQVDVRIAAKGSDEAAARALIAPVEAEIRARLGDTVFGMDGESLEGAVANRLAEQGRTLGAGRGGTGGLVSERLTSVPGMSDRLESLVISLEGARRRLGVRPSRWPTWPKRCGSGRGRHRRRAGDGGCRGRGAEPRLSHSDRHRDDEGGNRSPAPARRGPASGPSPSSGSDAGHSAPRAGQSGLTGAPAAWPVRSASRRRSDACNRACASCCRRAAASRRP